ncbi:MAG: thioredoxin family protein [Coriobacteriia bacterium]|nr:thioredoxin family protein [Coriobacteriia bacterium]
MLIEVLGSGCSKCNELEDAVRKAVARYDIDARVEHVSDIEKIMSYGVMMTPALVVDGEVLLTGRVPSVDEVAQILKR